MRLLPLFLACAGCGAPSPSPARIYIQAALLAQSDPAGAAALCATLAGDAAAECTTQTAAAAAVADPATGGALCAQVAEGLWRDECHFLVAEATVPVEGGAAAAAWCAEAGQFAVNCLDHVWRAHAGTLLGTKTPAQAAAAYAQTEAWADGVIAPGGERSGRFWQKFYDAPLHDGALPAIDLAWCQEMEGDLAARCRSTMPAALRRTLVRAQREGQVKGRPISPGTACGAGPVSERVEAAFGVRYVASEGLDAAAEAGLRGLCRGR